MYKMVGKKKKNPPPCQPFPYVHHKTMAIVKNVFNTSLIHLCVCLFTTISILHRETRATRGRAHTSPGWTVYALYRTNRLDLDPDLNQDRIGLFWSSNQLIHQICHNLSTAFWNIVFCIIFGQISQWVRIKNRVSGSRSRSSPKSHNFVLVTYPTCPQLLERSCSYTNRQAGRQISRGENITSVHLWWWR